MTQATRLQLLGHGLLIALSAGLVPGLVYGGLGLLVGRPPAPTLLVAIGLVGLAVSVGLWAYFLMRQIGRSHRRVADPMYRAKLIEFELATARSRAEAGATRT